MSSDDQQISSFDTILPYVTLAAANSYMAAQLGYDSWASLTDDQKTAALVAATLDIDQLHFVGQKYYTNQVRQWPRLLDMGSYGDAWSFETPLPVDVGRCCCEQAWYRIQNYLSGYDPEARQDHQDQGLSSINRVGGSENFDLHLARRHPLCPKAHRWIRDFELKTTNLRDQEC